MKRHGIKNRCVEVVGCAVCLMAMVSAVGGHWLVLQSVAWVRMIAEYSQQESLGSAISKTFDGQHPCGLCLSIQHGRQQEHAENRNLPCPSPEKTPELLCEVRRTVVPLPPEAATKAVPTVAGCHTDFIDPPPTPPPRSA